MLTIQVVTWESLAGLLTYFQFGLFLSHGKEPPGLVKRCKCLGCWQKDWRTALYVGDRKCIRPPPLFREGFSNLTWMASLTPLSNQWSDTSLQLLLLTNHFSALEWPRRYPLFFLFHHPRQRSSCCPAIMPNCSVDCSWSSSTQNCPGCYLLSVVPLMTLARSRNTSALQVPCCCSLILHDHILTLCMAVLRLLRQSPLLSSV